MVQFRKKNMSACQGSVTTEIYFCGGCEPAYTVMVVFFNNKSRFRKIIFRSQALHHLIGQPFMQGTNRRGIATKQLICKGINDVNRQFHLNIYLKRKVATLKRNGKTEYKC